jgi:putative ABC transport system permease protein
MLLSRFPATAVLASARSPGGGRTGTRVREALVVAQFGLAVAIATLTVLRRSLRASRAASAWAMRDD